MITKVKNNVARKRAPVKDAPVRLQLRPKHRLFVQEYLIDFNAAEAYIRAGYQKTRNSTFSAAILMRRPDVTAAIEKAMQERTARVQITQDRILEEYAKLAFLDPRRFYDKEGKLLPVHEMPQDIAAALSGIDVVSLFDKESKGNITTSKIKFADKKSALDSLARHLGMFTDKTEVSGPGGKAQEHVHNFSGSAEEAYRRMVETPKVIKKK